MNIPIAISARSPKILSRTNSRTASRRPSQVSLDWITVSDPDGVIRFLSSSELFASISAAYDEVYTAVKKTVR